MARTDELAREVEALRREIALVRQDAVAGDRELAVAIRRSRLGLRQIEQDEALRRLRPPTGLVNWQARQGEPSDPDIDASLLARLRRGNPVADSLGNTDVFAGVTNMIENPLVGGVANVALGTSFAPGTLLVHDWYGAYVNHVGTSPAASVAPLHSRADYAHNPFNSAVSGIIGSLNANSDQSAYVYEQDLSLLIDPVYPYMVVAMAVAGDNGATAADLTTLTAQLEIYDTIGLAVVATSQLLDLTTYTYADAGARRIFAAVAAPAGGWDTVSYHLRLRIRAVSGSGANRNYQVTWGDPQKHFSWSPDPAAFTPAVATWFPERLQAYGTETNPRVQVDETGILFGGGTAAVDVTLSRLAANILGLASGDTLEAKGLTSVVPADAAASATPTLTTTIQDITGAVLTFTPRVAETVLVIGTFDFNITTPSTAVGIGYLKVDALTEEAEQALAKLDGGTGMRVTVTRTWIVTLTGGASHTLQLRAAKTAALGAMTAGGGHTTISVIRFITG